ncbi:MAG: hypothetical protein IKX53_03345, partial [Bacteroidales bacterium]|nr:hypothetical protein [Bacteroidales bacterium]
KQTLSLEDKFDLIQGALTAGLDSAKTAIRQMTAAVNSLKDCVDGDQGLLSQIDSVATALGKIDTSLKDNVADALSKILQAIQNQPDYSALLTAISDAIKNLDLGGGGNDPDDPYNGHEYVDLGMIINGKPVYWATMNVGATKPEEYGDYFAWGETKTKDNYVWSTYQLCISTDNALTKYCNNSNLGYNGFTDDLTTLEPGDDAATANWGEKWRMPTETEWDWLQTYCTSTWTTQNGVNGLLVTAQNGKSIFLPAAGYLSRFGLGNEGSYGYYWSSSLYSDFPPSAGTVYFSSDDVFGGFVNRFFGLSVRPVAE